MTWLAGGTGLLAIGLAVSLAVMAIRLSGVKGKAGKLALKLAAMTVERDDYRSGLHDLKEELQSGELTAARDIGVLKARVDQCREVFNGLPENDLTHRIVNDQLDRLLKSETAANRNSEN